MAAPRSILLAMTLIAAIQTVAAGAPPISCTPLGFRGCDLDSDIVEFGQGALGGYGIEGRITSCGSCSPLGFPNPAGSFRLSANVEIEFGPYDSSLCAVGDDTVPLTLTSRSFKPGTNTGGRTGTEPTYIPVDGNEVFTLFPAIELRTVCVDQDFLDYRIPRLALTGLAGAKTEPKGSTVDADLVLPERVRAKDGTGLLSRLALDEARIRQNLTLDHTDTYGIPSELRLWPEALPFRLGPHDITYTETEVVFDTPGSVGGGPPAYTAALPVGVDGVSGLEPSQIVSCNNPTNGTCSSLPIENLGYLHQTGWSPSEARFDRDGLSLSLDLAAGREVTWELLYPTGVHMRLVGPARVVVEESRIADGYFGGGDIFVRGQGRTCDPQLGLFGHPRKHALRTGSNKPQVEAGGAILAGIENLNDNLGLTPQDEIVWAFNSAAELGCGTAFVPAAVTDVSPNVAWYQSAVTTTRGRGIYAGLNYNRNRVCFSSIGNIRQDKLCKSDADCDALQYCGDGGFSPFCGTLTSIPHWKPTVEGEGLDFAIPIADPLQRGREMAFVLRGSGVTGVFDAGDGAFRVGDSDPARFDVTFDRFGLAFKADDAEKGDTITQATIEAPWPALTELPLQEVEFCKCGGMDQGRPPQVALEANLAYWDQRYYPSAVRFMTEQNDECDAVEEAAQCGERDTAAALCVDAVVPLPRLAPQAVAAIEIHPNGRVPGMDIAHQTRLEFDRYDHAGVQQQPYQLDVVNVSFQNWDTAPSPKGVCDVLGQSAISPGCPAGSGGAPFGYLDVRGKIALPVFGLTQLGLAMQRPSKFTEAHTADAHEFSLTPGTGLSSFTARKSTSGATTDVVMHVDYFAPESITDTGDGVDLDGRGRGTFLAYGWEGDVDLGIVEPAAAFILRPEGP
ncbi:MAG: hypothetical protein HC882_07440, partial [Acidobacteria bacterium]|nr:hypothetical protein [Acidobacteriota bacterium]